MVKIFAEVNKQIPSKLLFVVMVLNAPLLKTLQGNWAFVMKYALWGKQEQMEDILAIADLFPFSPPYESFGLAALEAMAAGVPVISTNAGGLMEINVNGETGYTADVGDIESMCLKAVSILKDDDVLKTFKEKSRSTCKRV